MSIVEHDRLLEPDARVARSLAAMFNPQLYPGTKRQIELSQEELGHIVGASRQRISQALQVLEKAGLDQGRLPDDHGSGSRGIAPLRRMNVRTAELLRAGQFLRPRSANMSGNKSADRANVALCCRHRAREDRRWPGENPPNDRQGSFGKTKKADVRRSAREKPRPSGTAPAKMQPATAAFLPACGRTRRISHALTPLSFLQRSADIHPDRIAVIHGDRRITYRQFYERAKRLASALRQRRREAGRHGVGDAAERAGDAGSALRRADARRRAQHHQHAAGSRDRRLYPAARRGQGADHRPRICRTGRPGAGATEKEAARHRRGRRALYRAGRAPRQRSNTRTSSPRAIRISNGRRPRTKAARLR